nr:MAG TPA: hypothetical protein [Caudoviricetes sp.]
MRADLVDIASERYRRPEKKSRDRRLRKRESRESTPRESIVRFQDGFVFVWIGQKLECLYDSRVDRQIGSIVISSFYF